MEKAISLRLQKYQPCIFGKIAAKTKGMHYCILTENDLRKSDQHIREKIKLERMLWKQQALSGKRNPKHGFMILVISPSLTWAAPDANLKAFASRVRQLWGCPIQKDERGNDRAWEHPISRIHRTRNIINLLLPSIFSPQRAMVVGGRITGSLGELLSARTALGIWCAHGSGTRRKIRKSNGD